MIFKLNADYKIRKEYQNPLRQRIETAFYEKPTFRADDIPVEKALTQDTFQSLVPC